MKYLIAIFVAIASLSSQAQMNSKDFHLKRTENFRKCQDGEASYSSNGLTCGGGIGAIALKSTIIDTRSEAEKQVKARVAYHEYCKVFSNMTIEHIVDYTPAYKPKAGCKIITTSY